MGSTHSSTLLPLGLDPGSCCLCVLSREDPLASFLLGQEGGVLQSESSIWEGWEHPLLGWLPTDCLRWDVLSCPGSTRPMRDLAPDSRAALPALGEEQTGPAFHGHPLLSLPGQVLQHQVPRIIFSLEFLGTG